MIVSASVQIVGRFDAMIAGATFQWLASSQGNGSRRLSRNVPAGNVPGLIGFPRALPAQAAFEFSIADLRGLDPSLEVALHEQQWARLLVHTVTGRKARARIKYKRQ